MNRRKKITARAIRRSLACVAFSFARVSQPPSSFLLPPEVRSSLTSAFSDCSHILRKPHHPLEPAGLSRSSPHARAHPQPPFSLSLPIPRLPMSSRLSTQPTTTTATTNSATPAQPLHPGIDLNPTTGASILRAHLEACFRRGQLSDVTIRIDRFQREYRLHKVVLSQAQFFASLWTGGWSEEGGGGGGLAEPGMGGGVVSSDGGRRLNLQM